MDLRDLLCFKTSAHILYLTHLWSFFGASANNDSIIKVSEIYCVLKRLWTFIYFFIPYPYMVFFDVSAKSYGFISVFEILNF